MMSSLKNYICRLLDSQDLNADCLAFGILLGFLGFNALFAVITFVFVANAFCPSHVSFNARSVAELVTSLAGSYAGVLTTTATAYRWRKAPDAK